MLTPLMPTSYEDTKQWAEKVASSNGFVFVQFENSRDEALLFTEFYAFRGVNQGVDRYPTLNDLKRCPRRSGYLYVYAGESSLYHDGFSIYAAWRELSPTELLTSNY